jgi:hypothetical protein
MWKAEKQELTKKFHFQEIDRVIEFPNFGNCGKYMEYLVRVKCRDNANGSVELTVLGRLLESPEVENKYPHIVCYFKESEGEGPHFKPKYLEIRKIAAIEEFWLFLNALDI